MEYYTKLIDTVFRCISGIPEPKVLSLVADDSSVDQIADYPRSEAFQFPSTLLPQKSEVRQISNNETFIDNALDSSKSSFADCIFAFPPFLGRMRLTPNFKTRFGPLTIPEALSVTLVENEPSKSSVLALLTPLTFLGNLSCGVWRREFFPAHSALVIEHAHDANQQFLSPNSISLSLCTVVFTKSPGPIRFFKIDDQAVSCGTQRILTDLERLLRQPAGRSQFGYVHQGPLAERYPTTFDFYSEETQKLRQEISTLGERVALEKIADVLVGFRPVNPNRHDSPGITGFWSINASDISKDGTVGLGDIRRNDRPAIVTSYLQDGDFCIRQVYSADGAFVVGEYRGDGRQITWSPNVIVVRPKPELSPAQRQVLLSFLRSGIAQKLSSAKQTMPKLGGHLRISPSILRDFPVPIADKEIVSAIENLAVARAAFQEWIEEIDDASNAIVRESTASRSRNVILSSGQLARQRFRAATQVQELDYRIRTQYPHPLAYVWREVQVSGPDPYHRLRSIIKAAESHTCVMAQLAIVLSRASGQSIAYLNSIADRLATRGGGTNFGDWFSVVKEVTESRAFRIIPSGTPLGELRGLADNTSWEEAIRGLMELRNDDSHQRINPSCVSISVVIEAEHLLEKIFQATEFVTDYQLIQITENKFNSIRRLNSYRYRDLSGDNPLAPKYDAQTDQTDLEADSLYLRDREDRLHLLRPMLTYLECPECHQMSTFFLDTFNSAEPTQAGIKSIERNSVRYEPIVDDFKHVGLLR